MLHSLPPLVKVGVPTAALTCWHQRAAPHAQPASYPQVGAAKDSFKVSGIWESVVHAEASSRRQADKFFITKRTNFRVLQRCYLSTPISSSLVQATVRLALSR